MNEEKKARKKTVTGTLSKLPSGVGEHAYKFQVDDLIAERFKVIEQLGFGGFSEVYRCLDLRLNSEVALKIIPRDRLTKTVLQEAQMAAGLEHSHIVQVYDVARPEEDPFYIRMRLLTGGTLEKKLDDAEFRRLLLDEVTLRILGDVAEALDHAHKNEILHRDVKPSNILLDEDGRAYLADFGLAQAKRPLGQSAMTVDAQTSGTIPYMSPEQVLEKKGIDHRADVYALGVVAYEVLTGQLPYRGRASALLVNIAGSEPIPPRLANPELPKGVENVLLKVLNKDPKMRHQSCGEFVGALRQASQDYMKVEGLYNEAIKLLETKKWYQALTVLQQLEEREPGYKQARLLLERTGKHVQLLNFYAEAEKLLERKAYQECLNKLNVIGELDATFDVSRLREKAQQGLAGQQREALNEQYEQAVAQFEAGKYRTCLDTLETIRRQDRFYPDDRGIEPKARAAWGRQQRLMKLYQAGLDKAAAEEWQEAIKTFNELRQEEPNYRDVENQLAIARHLNRLSGIHRRALAYFEQGQYATCIDELDELARIDREYKQGEVTDLRQRAAASLYQQAKDQLANEAFEASLETLRDLAARDLAHGDPEAVVEKIRSSAAARERRKRLDAWYEEAQELLKEREYQDCLDKMVDIKIERPEFLDKLDVEQRAREGLRNRLSQEAARAYQERRYREAVALWDQALEIDPAYTMPMELYSQAKKKIEKSKGFGEWMTGVYEWVTLKLGPGPENVETTLQQRLQDWLWPWAAIVGGVIVLFLLGSLVLPKLLAGGRRTPTVTPKTPTITITPTTSTSTLNLTPTVTPTPTPTDTPTRATTATPTLTQMLVLTNTPTSTPTPTYTPSPTDTPIPTSPSSNVAVCTQAAAIFVAPNSDTAHLGYVAVGESVTVIGRASSGNWFYVRDKDGVEGFVYRPYFNWSGDFQALPTRRPTITVTPTPTHTPKPPVVYEPLSIDFWPVPDNPSRCVGNVWVWTIMIRGQGGNQVYTYYQDGEHQAGPLIQDFNTEKDELVHIFEVRGSCGSARIVTGRVESGDGQSVEKQLFLDSPTCCPP